MKISEIKEKLKEADQAHSVYFDFASCVPTTVNSWRGIYAEPAIGWAASGYSGDEKAPTVAAFLAELDSATNGNEYTGWKGGEYKYTDNDILHVDNPGDCSHTEIVDVKLKG